MASNITLSASVRQNLLSLQSTAELMSTTQNRLATGKKVNSALDNPGNFFTSQSLNNRASDLNSLLELDRSGSADAEGRRSGHHFADQAGRIRQVHCQAGPSGSPARRRRLFGDCPVGEPDRRNTRLRGRLRSRCDARCSRCRQPGHPGRRHRLHRRADRRGRHHRHRQRRERGGRSPAVRTWSRLRTTVRVSCSSTRSPPTSTSR